jgi:CubicO group peptidase (beta-lactamase class C family)
MIIEKATGEKQSDEIERLLLKPNGLDNILTDLTQPIPKDIIIAHGWDDIEGDGSTPDDLSEYSEYSLTWIATFSPMLTYSTAEDLAIWTHSLYHEKKILNEDSLNEMLAFHRPTPGEPMLSGYGFGVSEFAFLPVQAYGHLGSQYGYKAATIYFPEYGITISFLGNRGVDKEAEMAYMPVLSALIETSLASLE